MRSKTSTEVEESKPPSEPAGARSSKRRKKPRRSRAPSLRRRKGLYYPVAIAPEAFLAAFEGPRPATKGVSLAQLPVVDSQPGHLVALDDDTSIGGLLGGGAVARIARQLEASGELPGIPSALVVLARLREEAAAAIDGLLTFLDETEGDSDVEPNGDELDDGNDDDEDGADDEPSLGSREEHPSETSAPGVGDQTRWSDGADDDREDEHDGAEPDVDDEPLLGSVDDEADHRLSWPEEASECRLGIIDGEADTGYDERGRWL